jgi:phosphate uptake regulator
MGEVAATIWRAATDAIVDLNTHTVSAIEDIDDELDDLHVSLTAELTSGSMVLPVAVEVAMIGRFYERFGDAASTWPAARLPSSSDATQAVRRSARQALSAAPFRKLSLLTKKVKPFGTDSARRMRPT